MRVKRVDTHFSEAVGLQPSDWGTAMHPSSVSDSGVKNFGCVRCAGSTSQLTTWPRSWGSKDRSRRGSATFRGVSDGARTRDNRDHNPVLYQLSDTHHGVAPSIANR